MNFTDSHYNTDYWFSNSTDRTILSTSMNIILPLAGQCKWTRMNTLLAGFLLVTLFVNIGAAAIIFRVPMTTKRGTLNPVYLCIRLLNAIDILQALLLLLTPLFSDSDCVWWGGNPCCKAMGFLALFFVMASPLITVTMAIDRTVAIYFPIDYRNFLGVKMVKSLLPSFGLFTLGLIIPPLFGIGEYHVVRGRRFCLLDTITDDITDRMFVITVHAFYLIFLIFMMLCSVAFERKVIILFMKKKKTSALRRRANTATRTTIAVCLTFITCYTPFVVRVLREASSMKKSPSIVTWVTFALALLQPLLNPIVCLTTNVRYRTEFLVTFGKIKRSDRRWVTDSMTGTNNTSEKFPQSQGSQKGSPTKDFGRRRLNSSCRSRVTSPHPVERKNGRYSSLPRTSVEEKHLKPEEFSNVNEDHTQDVYHNALHFYPAIPNVKKEQSLDVVKEIDLNQMENENEAKTLNGIDKPIKEEEESHQSDADSKDELEMLFKDKEPIDNIEKQDSVETDEGIDSDIQIGFEANKPNFFKPEESSCEQENRDSGIHT